VANRISELIDLTDASFSRGDFTGAEKAARAVLAIEMSNAAAWERLVRIQSTTRDYEGLEQSYERLDRLTPGRMDILLRLAKVKQVRGNRTDALAVARRAHEVNPTDPSAVIMMAGLAGPGDSVILDLEAFVRNPTIAQSSATEVHASLVDMQNQAARRNAGLPPDRAISWDDLCTWKDAAGLQAFKVSLRRALAAPMASSDVLVHLGDIALRQGKWNVAEERFAWLRRRPIGFVTDITILEDELWQSIAKMSTADIRAGLPDLVYLRRGDPRLAAYSVFLSSDPIYFKRFTVQVLRALKSAVPRCHVHVHLSDGDEAAWLECADIAVAAFGPSLTVSAEKSDARARDGANAKNYYHAIRYVRFHQYREEVDHPLWILDVDAQINGDPSDQLSHLPSSDLAFVGNPNALVPWGKIAGLFVGAANTAPAREHLRLTAGFIATMMRQSRLRWFIDQLALYLAYQYLRRVGRAPTAWFPDETLVTTKSEARTAKFNFVIGARKHILL
jgi:tetratricopeptide (TPR) repeat protein